MALALQHQTVEQFVARLRERYRTSSREECARLAAWLYDHYQMGDFTAAQLRAAFGMNQTQFQAFVAKVQALRDHWVAVQGAAGE